MTDAAFEHALAAHDALVEQSGVALWIGGEPTFTDRLSLASEWLAGALGADKEERARRMTALLAQAHGGVILRTVGRQYPGEPLPRWSLGLYRRRDGQDCWFGPPDPLLLDKRVRGLRPDTLETLWAALRRRLQTAGWTVAPVRPKDGSLRLLCRCDGEPLPDGCEQDERLRRMSAHAKAIPATGLRDELAQEGKLLCVVTVSETAASSPVALLELPAFPTVAAFMAFLAAAGPAAREAGLESLILAGYPPPVDESIRWMTLTPDPAVVEVNMAPVTTVSAFLADSRAIFAAAAAQQLAPLRYLYNGQIADSGGGGQLTLGGPTPPASPFFRAPHLLPNLVCYFSRHPSLSYYFASDFVGGSSQSPRCDESMRDRLAELALTLELLHRQEAPTPELLWRSLAPFLADAAGNSHRSELNIEKLWNPYLPGRGCLGLVEFRALRMADSPERAAALAALLRAIALFLSREQERLRLHDWGDELHERFALPYFLRRDLGEVLAELEAAGVGLGQAIVERLLDDRYYYLGEIDFAGGRLTVRRGLEFWPLVGDVASQERGATRLVDSSSSRLELTLRPAATAGLDRWRLYVDGWRVPLRREEDAAGPILLCGLRFRNFIPTIGLHPALAAHGPVTLTLYGPTLPQGVQLTLHNWEPRGLPYDGLPADAAEAEQRRAERFVTQPVDAPPDAPDRPPPAQALTPYGVDLRWL